MADDATPATHPETAAPVPAPVATDPALPDHDLPSQVGRYRVEGEIARGGMGVVYRAADPAFGRTLAVKVLLPRHQGDASWAHRFLEEARICGQLQHPGVPPSTRWGRCPTAARSSL
jgi:hypothetical protein